MSTCTRRRPMLEALEGRLVPSTVVVNTTKDQVDASGSSTVSLRDAVAMANASSTATTITFDPQVFATNQTIKLTLGTRLILNNPNVSQISVVGPDAGVTISGNHTTGDFVVWTKTTAYFTHLTLTAGKSGNGAGIDIYGTATVVNSTITGNQAPNGGGVFNNGVGVFIGDTISNNTGTTGGGIWTASPGYTSLTNCTIALNYASYGGGLFNGDHNGATTTLHNVTIANNYAATGGGIFNYPGSTALLMNTLVANNHLTGTSSTSGPDVYGHCTSKGYNLIGKTDGSAGWLSTDLTGTVANPLDPKLGPLANNGGMTKTMLLLTGSPAIDHGSNANVGSNITLDQRGKPRINHGTVDIGAVEM